MSTHAKDVGGLLDAGAWTGYQKWVVALVALALLFDGLDGQLLGLAIPALMTDWQVTRADLAPVVAAGLIGMCFGTAIGGWAADRIGRRLALIGSIAVFAIATTGSAFVESVGALGAARFVVGLGLGGALPTATAMIAEFTPSRSRSVGIAIGMVTIPLGATVGSLTSAALIEDYGWQILFLLGGIVPFLLALVFFRALPESPAYLAGRPERRAELERVLSRAGLDITELAPPTADTRRPPFSALFGAGVRIDTLRVWTAFFLTMLALFTVISWGPAMLASANFPLAFTGTALAAFSFGGIAGAVVTGWLIARLGTRRGQLVMGGGAAAIAVVMAVQFAGGSPSAAMVAALIAALGFAITGMQNSMYILSAHLYPDAVRGTGVGAAVAVARLGAVASAYTGSITLDLGGGPAYFTAIAIGLVLATATAATVARPVPPVGG